MSVILSSENLPVTWKNILNYISNTLQIVVLKYVLGSGISTVEDIKNCKI